MQIDIATTPRPLWLTSFSPRKWLRNGHLQTIFGNYLPRPHNTLPEPEAEIVEVEPATEDRIASRLLCMGHWQPEQVRAQRITVIIVHGLEGSSNSQYVIGNATKLWRAGCNVIRMNMRNCGPRTEEGEASAMESFCPTLYHSGLSGDVLSVAKHFIAKYAVQQIALIGYSMGGNLVLKLAGEVEDALPQLKAVVAVSPAANLAASADALHLVQNRLYEQKFLRSLAARFQRKAVLFPAIYNAQGMNADGLGNPHSIARFSSIRDFDDRITAPYSGFSSAEDYYERAAAARVLDRIAVPTLVLHALDDPFIRFLGSTRAAMQANPNVALVETAYGGHCAFLAAATSCNDGYWAEHTAKSFLFTHAQNY